ncbi:MAG: sigma-54 dependent transcriptional regulator [Polyangia bacterium]|jgi:DNA-binding NtrC family response regulator|nr:sigma-54 dependent transcriptional regulator [Polyangia bacterium]
MTVRVLVVDDEAPLRYTLRAILEEDEGIEVLEAEDGAAALHRIDQERVDLVLTDLRMPRLDGMGLLAELARRPGAPRAILITAFGSERVAVEAMKRGALDYFSKPFEAEEILRVVRRSLEAVRLGEENRALRAALALRRTMVFSSGAMHRLAALVERAAPRDVTVLIAGESGTGKELVARALVKASSRATGPYVRFNCAALPRELAEAELFGHTRGAFTGAAAAREGLFRTAHGGTLLLDEIGELDLLTQGKLLRVLEEREVRPLGEDRAVGVDVRLLAATNRDLMEEVDRGRFRQDLFYRLNVISILVPPLRERPEDIVPLAEHFAALFGERYGLPSARLSDRVLRLLEARPWPGNVRELGNTVERLVALADGPVIDEDPFARTETDLQPADAGAALVGADPAQPSPLGLKERVAAFERGLVSAALERAGGNQSEAARRLGISRVTLIDKLKRHGLK